jgi:glycosyltransferase involved in cell wall biosynthesis
MARVSIGVPTYNGVEFIAECLTCLQGQTFEDFEVFISDNGSTDGTSDICADFARRDTRFRHVRFETTIPAGENFSRARDMTSAPYFMWRADDDLAEPDHLRGLVAGLDAAPDASIAVAPILRRIYAPQYREQVYELPVISESSQAGKIRQLLLGCHPSWFYGLWKRDVAVNDWDFVTQNYPHLWASDHLAMLPSIIDGKIVLVPEAKFIQRISRVASYHLPPESLLKARKRYVELGRAFLDARAFTAQDRRYMDKTLTLHVERRVAPLRKTYKRFIKQKFRAMFSRPA